jgi:hypothetical protein
MVDVMKVSPQRIANAIEALIPDMKTDAQTVPEPMKAVFAAICNALDKRGPEDVRSLAASVRNLLGITVEQPTNQNNGANNG